MAKSVKALITPEVLKWARERRIRLEIDHAAKKLKIEPERLETWENGTEQPTFAQLKNIAKRYKTHLSIFYLSEPPTDFQPLTDYRVLPKQEPKIEEQQIYRLNANIIEAYERRETLIELYELLEEPPTKITLNIDNAENKGENRRQAARKITEFLEFKREQLQQANDRYTALKFWKQTIEAKGILVCQTNPHLSIDLKTIFGCIVHNTELYQRLIPEELMRESKFYQLMLRENTIEHIIALLEQQFHTEAVRALTPMLQNIDDLERLKELHLAAARVPNIENFAQKLID